MARLFNPAIRTSWTVLNRPLRWLTVARILRHRGQVQKGLNAFVGAEQTTAGPALHGWASLVQLATEGGGHRESMKLPGSNIACTDGRDRPACDCH
jgi:hypothetical protein